MTVNDSVVALAISLAQAEQWDAALTLVELILSPQEQQVPEDYRQSPYFSPRAVSVVTDYPVQIFVAQELVPFLEQRPLEVLKLVQRNLERTITIEGGPDHDFSSIWRPAIEAHEQNRGHGEIKELLVIAARNALHSVTESMPEQGKAVAQVYLKHPYSIFRRLAIHSIRCNLLLWPDLVEYLFTDPRFLDDTQIYHEYWLLMNIAYDSLSTSIKNDFADCLISKLPEGEIEDDEQYHSQRYWVHRRLWAIRESLSSDEHRRLQSELEEEYGEPDHASLLSYMTVSWGSESPETSQKLSQMSPEEIVEALRQQLPSDHPREPSQEGLANALQSAVAESPQHFESVASRLRDPDLAPVFISRALRGFEGAWKSARGFDWKPVLDLCEWVSQTEEPATENGEPPDMKPGYWMTTHASSRSAVAELIEVGVVRDDNSIPTQHLSQARCILIALADDPNPSPEYERARGTEFPGGILDLALNVTRAKAIGALIQYSLHLARTRAQRREAEGRMLTPESGMQDEVKAKLTEKLDKQVDPSLAVHSMFGKFFPNLWYLDKEWVYKHLEVIFPRKPELSAYWEAAWDAYLFRSDFHGYLYDTLRPYYRYALEQMGQGRVGSELSQRRIASHLAALYWRGIEKLDDSDSLILLFFHVASDETRAMFVLDLASGLREVEPSADSEEWIGAKALWQARFREISEAVTEAGALTGHAEELGAYTDWVRHIPEDLGDFYNRIRLSALAAKNRDVILLLEHVASIASEHVVFAVELLEELAQQDRGEWFWAPNGSLVQDILRAAMESGIDEAKSCAIKVINQFGRQGDERYRDLLKLN
ncbi:MAG: hypothetical protein ACYTEQ_16085 [Planctomycetota bacterium]